MKCDPFWERVGRGSRAKEGLTAHLIGLIRQEYAIHFTTFRFKPSRLLYAIYSSNPLHHEKAWNSTRDYHSKIVQEWIVRAYLGNTRSPKRAQDQGWQFIGRWERGENGFLHVHGFLAVFVGDNSALGPPTAELADRLAKRSYHDEIGSIHCAEWLGPDSGAVSYILKESWRPESGEEFVFARAPDPAIIDQRPHLSGSITGWQPSKSKSTERSKLVEKTVRL